MATRSPMPPPTTAHELSERPTATDDGYDMVGYESAQPMFMPMDTPFGTESADHAGFRMAAGSAP